MIVGIYGPPEEKLAVVERLIGALSRKGYRVSSVKHTPHEKTVDREGKETWRHWKAGSDPVVFSSKVETSIIKHSETKTDEIANAVMREYRPDVLIFQGFKGGSFQKVAVGKVVRRKGTVLTNPTLSKLVSHIETEVAIERAFAQLPGLDCGKCGLDCRGLAEKITKGKKRIDDCKELSDLVVEIFVGGKKIPAGRFVSSVVNETVRGMLGALRGTEAGKDIEIRLKSGNGQGRAGRHK